MAFIITADGKRVAESSEGAFAPLLSIEYTLPSPDLPTVSVTASDPAAGEPADDGEFTFTRTGPTTGSLTVNYMVSGSATPDVDYTALSGAVTVGAGQASATVPVTVLDESDP